MASILKALSTPPAAPVVDEQCVFIDLPGEAVRCWRRSDNLRVVKRRHRNVVFDINLKPGASYTVETSEHKSEFYNARDNMLVKRATFNDGEKFNLWVSRDFKGELIWKENYKILGRYSPNSLDKNHYGSDPKTKPEPLLITLKTKPMQPQSFGQCTPQDPYGYGLAQLGLNSLLTPQFDMLKPLGATNDYEPFMDAMPDVQEYTVVTIAELEEISAEVRKRLEDGKGLEGTPEQILAPIKPDAKQTDLTNAINTFVSTASSIAGEVVTANAFKETAGYVQENWRQFNKLGMRIHIEKAKIGKYKVVLKGRLIVKAASTALGIALASKKTTSRVPTGRESVKWLGNDFQRSGRGGLGGYKRVMTKVAENFKAGVKIQIIGTIIDISTDAIKVFGEGGSKDLSEFLARAGVSVAKAGLTAALGSVIAAILVAGVALAFGAVAAPVALVVATVVASYIFAAWVVDKIDEGLDAKERAANYAR
jgi:hypothetical protein